MKSNLKDVVGSGRFFDDKEILEEYSGDCSFVSPGDPSCVVKPESREEVEDIVKEANETGAHIVPVSSGPPHFRGDTVPSDGDVILDLSKMNDIKMVDRLDRVAMIEPGVRFAELQERLKEEGLRLPTPLCPRESKSVIGSCLEREPHIIPKYHLDHSEPLLCNEVVFGTGDLFRTGEAGGPGTIEEQREADRHQKIQSGIQINLTRVLQGAQGTMGIVTWSTVRCELLPQARRPFLVSAEDLQDLLECSHHLVRRRLGDELFLLNNQMMVSLIGDGEAEDLRKSLPPWLLFFCLAGYEYFPEERIDYQEKDAEKIAENLGLDLVDSISGVSASKILEVATGVSSKPYWKIKQMGNCQDIYFIASFHDIPNLLKIMADEASKKGYPSANVGAYIQPVCQGHGQHVEVSLPYNPEDSEEGKRVKDLYLSASKRLMDNGAFFSRPYDLLAEPAFDRDVASRDALRKVKGIFDPNKILNPGKLCF